MKLRVEHLSLATVEQTFASHVHQDVRERACRETGALSYEVLIETVADGGARVQVERVMEPRVPDYLRGFVGESILIQQVEEWSGPDGSGARTAAIKLTIKGQPASMVGSALLAPAETGSVEVITGDVKVAIPLVGRKIEPEIVKVIEAALRIEQRVVQEWALDNR